MQQLRPVIVNQGYVPQTTMVQPQTTMVKPQLQVVRKGSIVKPAMTGKMPLRQNASNQTINQITRLQQQLLSQLELFNPNQTTKPVFLQWMR